MPTITLPSADEEIWRYSRIAELDFDSYTATPTTATVDGWAPDRDATTAPEPPVDVFAELNARHADALVLRIPAGRVVADPIEVRWAAPPDGAAVSAAPPVLQRFPQLRGDASRAALCRALEE